MASERIEKLLAMQQKAEAQKRKAEQQLKAAKHKISIQRNKERTHRLCERGGHLEHYLPNPELLMDEDVLQTFHLVNNYLFPGGIFIFDFNTIYKYEEVIGDTTIAENREDCSFIWENFYSCEDHINEYDVTVFERQEDDLYRRFTETHYQRGYTLEEMKTFLEKAGLIFVTALDEKTHKAPTETSERIYVIAREHGKQ